MVAAAVIGSAVVGAGATAYGASQAADAQKSAAASAQATQRQMFDTTQQNLEPYNTIGQNALTQASALTSAGGFQFNPTQEQLQKTPGYQFNLTQGMKGVMNSAAARGLGNSGAALKGAASFATGLADSTYQNQFNNALTGYQTNYNNLTSQAQLGEAAAAGVGSAALTTGQGIAASQIGAGNAAAGASIATGNALAGGANNIGSIYSLNALTGGKLFGSGGGGDVSMYDAAQAGIASGLTPTYDAFGNIVSVA